MEEVIAQAPEVKAGLGGETMLAPQEVQRMLALRALGWGAKRISAELGCSRNTVREYLRRGGWKPMDVSRRASVVGPHREWLAERLRQHRGNADAHGRGAHAHGSHGHWQSSQPPSPLDRRS